MKLSFYFYKNLLPSLTKYKNLNKLKNFKKNILALTKYTK